MATIEIWNIINEEYFKKYSPLPENYNIEDIKSYFHVAEKLWVEPIIGTPLYEELLEQVNTNTVSETNSTLLLKIYPYLSFAIAYEALPFISYHMTEIGITKGKSENSDSVSINDVNYITKHLRAQVELMKKLLKEFLEEHKEFYPLYRGDECTCVTESDCDGYEWVWDYYNGGIYDRYDWINWLNKVKQRKGRPNAYLQLYATNRHSITNK